MTRYQKRRRQKESMRFMQSVIVHGVIIVALMWAFIMFQL